MLQNIDQSANNQFKNDIDLNLPQVSLVLIVFEKQIIMT